MKKVSKKIKDKLSAGKGREREEGTQKRGGVGKEKQRV
jgi:hypothetical protein